MFDNKFRLFSDLIQRLSQIYQNNPLGTLPDFLRLFLRFLLRDSVDSRFQITFILLS
jgi:hypothetical protein